MFEESVPIDAPDTPAHRLANALDGLLAVEAADAIPATVEPRDEPTVELVLRAEYDYLPGTVADIIYAHGFAPAEIGARTPDHVYALAIAR